MFLTKWHPYSAHPGRVEIDSPEGVHQFTLFFSFAIKLWLLFSWKMIDMTYFFSQDLVALGGWSQLASLPKKTNWRDSASMQVSSSRNLSKASDPVFSNSSSIFRLVPRRRFLPAWRSDPGLRLFHRLVLHCHLHSHHGQCVWQYVDPATANLTKYLLLIG